MGSGAQETYANVDNLAIAVIVSNKLSLISDPGVSLFFISTKMRQGQGTSGRL